MSEIELLRELRAGLPDARPEKRAAARAGLMAAIEGLEGASDRPRPVPRWRSARLKLLAAGACLAALLVVLATGVLGGGGKVQPAVAAVLNRTAAVAAEAPPAVPGPGQYLYTRSRDAYLTSTIEGGREWSVLVPARREAWISLERSRHGRLREVRGAPQFLSKAQRAAWRTAGAPSLPRAGAVEDTTLPGGGNLDTSGLPTDPAALRRLIEARKVPGVGGPPGEAETFTLIGDMLREAYLPPPIRAALFRLTAELPGVELLGQVRDPAGRPGTGISFTDRRDGTRHELIFDPATAALLGERESVVRSGAFGGTIPPGTVVGYAAYLESKVVDSLGAHGAACGSSVSRRCRRG